MFLSIGSWQETLYTQLGQKVLKDVNSISRLKPSWESRLALNAAGRTEEAIGWVEKTPRLSPLWPGFRSFALGQVYHSMGRFDEAIAALKKALTDNDGTFSRLACHGFLAASYSALGREEEARAEAAEVLKINPRFSLEVGRQRWPYKDPADLERFIDHLRKAGLK